MVSAEFWFGFRHSRPEDCSRCLGARLGPGAGVVDGFPSFVVKAWATFQMMDDEHKLRILFSERKIHCWSHQAPTYSHIMPYLLVLHPPDQPEKACAHTSKMLPMFNVHPVGCFRQKASSWPHHREPVPRDLTYLRSLMRGMICWRQWGAVSLQNMKLHVHATGRMLGWLLKKTLNIQNKRRRHKAAKDGFQSANFSKGPSPKRMRLHVGLQSTQIWTSLVHPLTILRRWQILHTFQVLCFVLWNVMHSRWIQKNCTAMYRYRKQTRSWTLCNRICHGV